MVAIREPLAWVIDKEFTCSSGRFQDDLIEDALTCRPRRAGFDLKVCSLKKCRCGGTGIHSGLFVRCLLIIPYIWVDILEMICL